MQLAGLWSKISSSLRTPTNVNKFGINWKLYVDWARKVRFDVIIGFGLVSDFLEKKSLSEITWYCNPLK